MAQDFVRSTDRLLFGGRETTFGVLPAFIATSVVDGRNIKRTTTSEKKQRVRDKNYRGGDKSRRIKKQQTLSWQSDLIAAIAGGNTPGPLSPFLRGCGLTETILTLPTPRVRYTPTVNAGDDSCGFKYLRRDANDDTKMLQWLVPGGVGSAKLRIAVDDDPTIDFDFLCAHSLPASVIAPTADYSLYGEPSEVNVVTSELIMNGVEVNGLVIEVDLGYTKKTKHGTMLKKTKLTSRETTASITIFDPGIAPNLYQIADDELQIAVVFDCDDGAGKRIRVELRLQLEEPEESDQDDSAGNTISAVCIPSGTGNDDFILDLF